MSSNISDQKEIFKNSQKNVFNIRAEKLIREASDTFLYFKDYELALKQVNEVLRLEKNHTRALLLKGDILLCMDKDKEALESYEIAIQSDQCCAQAYGSKAGILDMLGRQEEALENCNLAFKFLKAKDKPLLIALYDQKLSILQRLHMYDEAKKALSAARNDLSKEDANYLASCYRSILENCNMKKQNTEMSLKLVY